MKHPWTAGLACTFGMAAGALAADAEYAVRWDPSQGGPKTAAAVLSVLGQGPADEKESFEVRYASEVAGASAPAGARVILRERFRSSKPRHELTFKLRSDAPLPPTPEVSPGRCPAGAAAAAPKDEVDVAFGSVDASTRVHSRSCTVQSKTAKPVVPKALQARFAPCTSRTTRLKAGRLKVEEWQLAGGRVAIEASRTGPDTALELEAFRREVVKPLLEVQGATPLRESKTEMGSDCGG